MQTINPGAYLTGFNDRIADTTFRWLDDSVHFNRTEDVKARFAEILADQYDPQDVIDKMVEIIGAEHGSYRNVWPRRRRSSSSRSRKPPGAGRSDPALQKETPVSTDARPSVFERLDLPDTGLTRDTYEYVAGGTPLFVFHHSVRSYVFARAHARNQGLRAGTDYDDEQLFASCLLHDIGLSDEGNGDQRFEVDGADTAVAFLRGRGVEERRIAITWDAIALRRGTEVALTQAGIGTDILGLRRESLPAGLADRVHTLLPRQDLAYALSDAIVAQARAKPHKAPPMTFPGGLMRHHLPYGAHPTWYDLLGVTGWGDQPVGVPPGAAPRRRSK